MAVNLAIAAAPDDGADPCPNYGELLALVERLHRLLLDVIKEELDRLALVEINAVQALLLYNLGDKTMTAGELKARGYYQGSNVSYNLKKLVELGHIDQRRCEVDRRATRIRVTERGASVQGALAALFRRHREGLCRSDRLRPAGLEGIVRDLRSVERYWAEASRPSFGIAAISGR